ncbi:hypothetical protein [Pseudomonas costantinii]|uniref:Uncharacterized protein n=1 Tax=Pseudomonas costantinii TaxID=168469 RepID=A0A1S2UDL5_9PSED|nr:hypothetical protein [Pseudomonas costantinii]OIN44524.1 hypothetical protein BFL40_30010 [Pseudomonas costantinii]SED26746.1 hypothetical protein SAMN04515675_0495 [Pseudomonas costantinii]
MKLIIKRVPHAIAAITLGATGHLTQRPKESKERPFALFTEDGVILPMQQSVVTESLAGKCPTVTVTFYLNGEDIKVQGDD